MKKIILALIFGIFLVGTLSAMDWDNKVEYSNNDLNVKIYNSNFLIFKGEEFGTAELKSHKSVDEIKKVGVGNQIVMWYDFDFNELYENGIGEISFTDVRTGKEVERDYKLIYWKTERIFDEVNNTYYEKGEWADYDSNDLPKGKIRIGIRVKVELGDYVDGVWTIAGKKISRHATWENNVEEAHGETLDAGGPGGASSTAPRGVTFYSNSSDRYVINVTRGVGADPTTAWLNFSNGTFIKLGGFSGNTAVIEAKLIDGEKYLLTASSNGSNYNFNYSGAFTGLQGTHILWHRGWNGAAEVDNIQVFESLFTGTPGTDAPKITLNSPANVTNFTTNEVNFNCTVWDNTKIVNGSLILDAVINETNSTELNNTYYYFTKYLSDGDHYWTCQAFDDDGLSANGSMRVVNVNTTPNIAFGAGVPVNEYNSSADNFEVNVSITETFFQNLTFDLYNRGGTVNRSVTFTNASREKDWTNLIDGNYSFNVTVATTTSQFNFTETRNITFDTTNPNITITNPSNSVGSHILNTNLTVNWTIDEQHIDTCIIEYREVNRTVTCSDFYTEINITDSQNRTVTLYMNDTFGHVDSDTQTWSYDFLETASEYSGTAYETANKTFKINVSTTQTIRSFSASLYYNGTTYAADSSCSSGNCEIETTIDIPLLNTGQITENKTFFWRLTLFNESGTSNINTTSNVQNVSLINMSSCPGIANAVNYTIYDEDTLVGLVSEIDASFDYYLGEGSVTKTANLSATSSTFSMCIEQNETFIVNSQIDLAATSYKNRRYDYIGEVLTNVTKLKSLYLSNSSLSSDIIIEVRDEGLVPLSGIIVNISRYYPDLGKFITISSQKTDNFGQFVEKLIQNDVRYKFQFYQDDGTLLKTSDDIRIACRATICVLPFVIEGTVEEFEDFEEITLFNSDLSFDNTTKMFSLSWNDQTGKNIIIRLEVTRYLLNSSSIVCNTTSTSTLSTLTCSVGNSTATHKAQAYRRVLGSREIRISILNVKSNDPYSTYGAEGLLWVFILLFTCIGIGAFNPSVGLILYGVGFIAMGIIGIISMPIEVFFANTLLVGIFIWAIKT